MSLTLIDFSNRYNRQSAQKLALFFGKFSLYFFGQTLMIIIDQRFPLFTLPF